MLWPNRRAPSALWATSPSLRRCVSSFELVQGRPNPLLLPPFLKHNTTCAGATHLPAGYPDLWMGGRAGQQRWRRRTGADVYPGHGMLGVGRVRFS